MSQTLRIPHIDSLRGLAVLLMVMVHAAATWNPFDQVQLTPLAYIVSGLGGLAAPLFVTLFGWGIARGRMTAKQRLFQAVFLLIAQIGVNITSPHLFHFLTPGILSLMAILTLILPPLIERVNLSDARFFSMTVGITFALQMLIPELQGTGVWSDHISDEAPSTIVSNLFFTGTYPVFPWFLFALLGAVVSQQTFSEGQSLPHTPRVGYSVSIGVLFCIATLLHSQMNDLLWAHPTADATLTFFPANPPFLIAGTTGVVLLWLLIQRFGFFFLNSTGKLSLTIYLIHFVPLTLMRDFEVTHQWGLQTSTLAVLLYTLAWIPVATLWLRRYPRASAENVLRAIRKSL